MCHKSAPRRFQFCAALVISSHPGPRDSLRQGADKRVAKDLFASPVVMTPSRRSRDRTELASAHVRLEIRCARSFENQDKASEV